MSDDESPAVVQHRVREGERDVTVVSVHGDVDVDSAPRLAEALHAAERASSARTVVDLSATGFADSAILHVLLEAQQAHLARGRPLVVAGPLNESIERLFEVTGTARFFVLAPDVRSAVETPWAVTER
ncbi:STAS domain-containing protein [Streptomyces sp. SLBN-31]|uniref:STAS domain-containing protein n=1 Tax=Streptomyces sp. SLBN-31 TaxID=2768444 RepID=UPI001154725C|nr:STAS domain-containing protein [Streptomyces sp. SLBN-31]TQJ85776.1 anti-sigma B factor antagonist [Streptomyces sp. SLBN-31]